jgi:hypothetical protein
MMKNDRDELNTLSNVIEYALAIVVVVLATGLVGTVLASHIAALWHVPASASQVVTP